MYSLCILITIMCLELELTFLVVNIFSINAINVSCTLPNSTPNNKVFERNFKTIKYARVLKLDGTEHMQITLYCHSFWSLYLTVSFNLRCSILITSFSLLSIIKISFCTLNCSAKHFLTCNCELPLCADSGSIIPGNAGIVAIVFKWHLGYLEGAHELFCVNSDAWGGHDLLTVFAPRNVYGHVSWRHHAGNVHQFTNWGRGKVKWLDQWRN